MYVCYTADLEARLIKHNSGECAYTVKYKSWKVITFVCFDNQEKAIEFERYLKTVSGSTFAKRHL